MFVLFSLARGLGMKRQLIRYTANPRIDNMLFCLLLFPSAYTHHLRNGSKVENLLYSLHVLLALMPLKSTLLHDL